MSALDNMTSWVINRYAHAKREWAKANAPAESQSLLMNLLGNDSSMALEATATPLVGEDLYKRAIQNWVYADITLIAREFSAADLGIVEQKGEQQVAVANHPFETLYSHPNPEFDITFLWQYTQWWLQLKGNAYWFLSPERGALGNIREIWPVRADRVTPVPGKTTFIEFYMLKTSMGKTIKIDPKYLVHYMLPNPFSLYSGLAPLSAALLDTISNEEESKFQTGSFASGRGIPASVLLLNEDMSERDFIATSALIREEFENERKLIIARGGDLKVGSVGISQREMDLVRQRQFTRDAIDTVFLGTDLRNAQNDGTLKEKRRFFRESTIFPLHKLLSGQLNVQLVHPFYGEQYYAQFEDVRAQDKALAVQERNVYWRVKKVDEARQDLGLGPMGDDIIPGYGEMPVPLATDPAFMAMKMGLSSTGRDPQAQANESQRKPEGTGSLETSDAPKRQLNQTAQGKALPAPDEAQLEAQRTELKRWQKVALKEARSGKNPGRYEFRSNILSAKMVYAIRGALWECERTESAVKAVFEVHAIPRIIQGAEYHEVAPIEVSESV